MKHCRNPKHIKLFFSFSLWVKLLIPSLVILIFYCWRLKVLKQIPLLPFCHFVIFIIPHHHPCFITLTHNFLYVEPKRQEATWGSFSCDVHYLGGEGVWEFVWKFLWQEGRRDLENLIFWRTSYMNDPLSWGIIKTQARVRRKWINFMMMTKLHSKENL